jgi:hypothetical protein
MSRLFLFFGFLFLLQNCQEESKKVIQKQDTTTVFVSETRILKQNKIPDSVFSMTKLKYLSIKGMDCDYREADSKGNDITQCWMIREIPVKISNLKELEVLDLSVNAIHAIPPEIANLQKMRIINLTDNPGLQDIEGIVNLPNLEELYLYGCNLSGLPKGIKNLKKLKKIGLTGNHIDKSEIDKLRKQLPKCEINF